MQGYGKGWYTALEVLWQILHEVGPGDSEYVLQEAPTSLLAVLRDGIEKYPHTDSEWKDAEIFDIRRGVVSELEKQQIRRAVESMRAYFAEHASPRPGPEAAEQK